MELTTKSVADFGHTATADVLCRGFADYIVKVNFSEATLARITRTDSIDCNESRVIFRDGIAVGAALVARRGWTSRIAGMSLVPAARGQGIGRWVLDRLAEDAKARGDRTLVLEVIEQNLPAVGLYEAWGFQKVRRLLGFELQGDSRSVGDADCAEIDPRSAAYLIAASGISDLPWQVSAESVAQLSPPFRALASAGACIVASDLGAPEVSIRGVGAPLLSSAGKAQAGDLLRTVISRHPGKLWRMSAVWPEELGDVFLDSGFARTKLSQWQMFRALG